jgi:hypothetical protein
MRKAEREIKDRAEIDGILRRAQIIHIAMVDNGEPYVVPVDFGYADGAIYIHGATEGRKIDVLTANPRVCFETYVDHQLVPGTPACSSSSKFRCVIGCGTASIITARDEKIRGLDVIMSKISAGPQEYSEQALARTALIRIDISEMTGKKLGY